MSSARADGRGPDVLRPVTIEPGALAFAEGSALISVGRTRVLCAATLEDRVPPWMRGRGTGWVTAEYAMLPRATQDRTPRESSRGRIGGRTHEIQRLIGRALRTVVDMRRLGERSVLIDCDVLQADGGTRTASITGAYVALALALRRAFDPASDAWPVRRELAAVSVGYVDGTALLDLPYEEDSRAEVDMNVAMTASGEFVEVQGTAEGKPFSRAQLDEMLRLAEGGIRTSVRPAARGSRRSAPSADGEADRARLQALVDDVASFYVRDRALLRAQAKMTELLAAAGEPPAAETEAYLAAIRRYFVGFDREAHEHLRDVERRLAKTSQLQFNLTAERGVAARRVTATQGVLSQIAECADA